jgi:NADPH2:quinone reductase
MRRVRYYEYGGPEVLQIEEAEIPAAGPGQVLIRTEVVGASWVDTAMRRGISAFGQQPLPGSPHGDVVGTVEAAGDGVDQALLGQRVAALVARDAYADYVVADADWLASVPASVGSAEATVLSMPAPVALGILRAGRLAAGETVLVHAAGGSLGHLLTQLARQDGAGTIIATVGAPGKADFAREHGADVVISYRDSDWPDQVRAAAPGGVDVIADSLGGEYTATNLDLLAPLGRLVIYGALSGGLPSIPAAGVLGLRYVTGFGLVGWRAARPALARRDIADAAARVGAGQLRVAVSGTVPLAAASKAHELLEDRTRVGRVLIVP